MCTHEERDFFVVCGGGASFRVIKIIERARLRVFSTGESHSDVGPGKLSGSRVYL